jgi:hypothetical protein
MPRIRLVGVFPLLYRLDNARRIPFGVLDLLLRLLVHRAPYVRDVEEGCCGVKRCCGLPGIPSAGDSIKSENLSILCHSIGLHNPFCSVKGFLGELLDVCLPGGIICHGVFARVLCLGLRQVSWPRRQSELLIGYPNLFHLLDQVCCVAQNVFVGCVQLLRQDLVDCPILACNRQKPPSSRGCCCA